MAERSLATLFVAVQTIYKLLLKQAMWIFVPF